MATSKESAAAIMEPQAQFRAWLREEMDKRNLKGGHAMARKFRGVSRSSTNRILQGDPAGIEYCVKLALAMKLPPTYLLEMAGHAPRQPPKARMAEVLTTIYNQLDEDGRADLIRYAYFLRDR